MLAALLVVATVAGCSSGKGDEEGPPDFAECGLPKADPKARAELLPEPFLLGGAAEVARTEMEEDRLIAALNVPHTVQESFDLYKKAIPETDFEILQEDNEGFEAELYLRRGKELGSLQIRSSTCDNAVIVYANLPPA